MKVLKVRIRRGNKGEPMMVYPARYDAEEVDRNGLGPCNVNGTLAYSGHIGKGGSEEWCYIALEDKLADEYALDPDMEIVTPVTADADMEAWRVANGLPAEHIDSTRIQAIAVKQAAGIVLSQADLDALDPTKPEPGITPALKKLADMPEFKVAAK